MNKGLQTLWFVALFSELIVFSISSHKYPARYIQQHTYYKFYAYFCNNNLAITGATR